MHDKMRQEYRSRIQAAAPFVIGDSKFVKKEDATKLLEAVVKSGDRVCLEGDNQKQADFLARALLGVDPGKIHDLHLVQSSIVLPEHMELFEKGIARNLDFAFSGPQSKKLYELVTAGKVNIGAIHTYLELYGRYFVDLFPRVSLVVAEGCDANGNLYTGYNTEDTPLICEATKFKSGIVIAQVKEKTDSIPRVDIPGDWVDFVIETGEDYYLQPLFTRDPAKITDQQILMAMMLLKGVYGEYGVKSLNHGLGFPTAAIELLLPTYGEEIGLKGNACTHWVLNPHPTMIPAIEAGFVEEVYCFGGEPGMERYVNARPDIFAIGPDGSMRSSRCNAHIAGLYGIDMFTGATLQIDKYGNSSTAIKGMIAGFGGAPNLGGTPPGRRHITDSFQKAGYEEHDYFYGKKLVVQVTPTVSAKKGIPVFVNELYAHSLFREGLFDKPPVMIGGDQMTHICTEKGVAYLDRCHDVESRMRAVAAVAGDTPVGETIRPDEIAELRDKGIVRTAEDLGIDAGRAGQELLAARSLEDLVEISGGLYDIPEQFLK